MLVKREIADFEFTPDPTPVIGGTLCLMSCALTSLLNAKTTDSAGANLFYIKRIADNLALLADDASLDVHFRRVCRRLWEHWDARLNVRADTDAGKRPDGVPAREADTCLRACADALAASIRLH
jgi:hypothetical protein